MYCPVSSLSWCYPAPVAESEAIGRRRGCRRQRLERSESRPHQILHLVMHAGSVGDGRRGTAGVPRSPSRRGSSPGPMERDDGRQDVFDASLRIVVEARAERAFPLLAQPGGDVTPSCSSFLLEQRGRSTLRSAARSARRRSGGVGDLRNERVSRSFPRGLLLRSADGCYISCSQLPRVSTSAASANASSSAISLSARSMPRARTSPSM